MKKKLSFIPIVLFGLVLSSCAVGLKDNFTEADQTIDTPWSDYVLPATQIEFADGEENISLIKGETHTYSYSITPKGATNNSLNWFSANENVVTVDNGVATAVGGGETTITVSVPDNSFDPVQLNVNVSVPLTDFSLDIPAKLEQEEEYRFDVTFVPEDTTEREIKYEIKNPSVENLVSVDEQGVVKTTNQNGSAKLEVKAGKITKQFDLVVSTVEVSKVTISGTGHEVEANHTLELSATIEPSNARDITRKGIKYYSRNPEIAKVDEVTGVVTGVAPGNASLYAKCGDVESNDYAVSVYKVNAVSVDINTADFSLSNADDNSLTKQLAYTLTLDRPDHANPSDAKVSFSSSNEGVATVSDSGLVTAKGPGNAVIKVTVAQPGQADIEDSVNVEVNIYSTSLNIVGGNSFNNDSTLTLTAQLTPNNVSNDEITWEVIQEKPIVSLSSTKGSSVTLTPVNNDVTGKVTVKARNTNGAYNELEVTVNDAPSYFSAGHHYIVGSALYNTGESVTVEGKSSWNDAKYAYEFTYEISDPSVYEQYKGTIKFNAGDEFRYFIGTDYWVPNYELFNFDEVKGYHIEQNGENNAFAKGQMKFASDDVEANIQVVEAGYYDLYAKLYVNEDHTIWYSLYIQKVPSLNVELDNITMGLEESYQIKAHDWIGNISYTVKSGEDLITLSPSGLVTGKGTAGTAVVTVNDDRNVPVDVTIKLQDGAHAGRTIYLNANGKFDTDNVVPFIHSWGEEGASEAADTMMNKVEGQEIVYFASIPLDHTNLDFVRCAEGSTSIVWEEIYNQSKDQLIPNDKDMFTMTGWLEEQDNSHRTYLDGSWSVFDANTVYTVDGGQGGQEDPHGDSYVMYTTDGQNWSYLALADNPNDDTEVMGSIDFEAGTEFVIKVSENDWRHFENNKDASTLKVVEGSEVDSLHNFVATEDGTYAFYIVKDSSFDGGKTVYIGFEAQGGQGGDEQPVAPYVMYGDGSTWNFLELKDNPENEGELMGSVELDADTEFVIKIADDDWRHFENNKDASSNKVVEGSEAYATHNFKASEDGTYTFYILKNKDAEGGKTVYIGFEGQSVQPTTYTVSFNANGGTGSKAAVEGVSGEYTLPDSTGLIAPETKVFSGWALAADGEVIATATINVTADVTLFAIWENEVVVPNNVTIYLTANWEGWEEPNAYVFNSSTDTGKVAWPGEAMTYVGVNDDNDTIYSYTVDINSYDRIVFSNGDKQTVDIDISAAQNGDAYYLKETNDQGKIVVEKWGTFTNAALTSKQIVYFTNNKGWNNPNFYVFNSSTEANAGAWPGSAAKWVCNNEHSQGVYRLVIDSENYNAFIFNDGNGNQSIDILLSSLTDDNNAFYLLDTQDSQGHYEVGQWKK